MMRVFIASLLVMACCSVASARTVASAQETGNTSVFVGSKLQAVRLNHQLKHDADKAAFVGEVEVNHQAKGQASLTVSDSEGVVLETFTGRGAIKVEHQPDREHKCRKAPVRTAVVIHREESQRHIPTVAAIVASTVGAILCAIHNLRASG